MLLHLTFSITTTSCPRTSDGKHTGPATQHTFEDFPAWATAATMAGTALSFPTSVEEFGNDDRISYSRLSNKYIGVHDDGSEFEFHPELKRWIIVEDEHDDDLAQDPHATSNKRKTSPAEDEVSGACHLTQPCRRDGSLYTCYT